MKLILCEDVKNLGRAGETVKVTEGFGRNYLLPKSLAVMATPANVKRLQQELNSKKGKARRIQKDAEYQAEAIAAKPLVITASVGEGGKLFGSVTAAEIEKELEKRGVSVDKRKIMLEEPIKTAGTHQVSIKLHPEVSAELKVMVQGEDSMKAVSVPDAGVKAEASEGPNPLAAESGSAPEAESTL
ncbi:50S ribosomal protein L9 [candidate division FCPU426 bacterium]|nr:50S ribosomal protein L9 [candidate division FCPU426 bacterium]